MKYFQWVIWILLTVAIGLYLWAGVLHAAPVPLSIIPCDYGTVYYDNKNGFGPAYAGQCPTATYPDGNDYRTTPEFGAMFYIVDPSTGKELRRFADPRFLVFPLEMN